MLAAIRYRRCLRLRLSASIAHSRGIKSSKANSRTFVGPPDPVSNLRPAIYDEPVKEGESSGKNGKGKETHPYSLDEFDGDPTDYQWRLERQRLDAFNHAFWTDSNTRFESAKRVVLESLPDEATPEYREAALQDFYRHWITQERGRMKEYSDEWRRRNFAGIMLAARVAMAKVKGRLSGGLTSSSGFGQDSKK